MHASAACSLHEARLLENTHVLGHRLERHVERFRQLGHGLLRARDPPQDRPPRRMREGPKHAVQVLFATINHKVDYQHRSRLSTNSLSIERRRRPEALARYRAAVLDDRKGKALAAIVAKLRKAGHEVGTESYKKVRRPHRRPPAAVAPIHSWLREI